MNFDSVLFFLVFIRIPSALGVTWDPEQGDLAVRMSQPGCLIHSILAKLMLAQ